MLHAGAQHKPSNNVTVVDGQCTSSHCKGLHAFLSSNDMTACKVWPPNSPDLNPIQTVWAVMKQQVYSRHYNTLVELMAAVEWPWQGLTGSYLKTLMASFSSCKAKCLLACGGYEEY